MFEKFDFKSLMTIFVSDLTRPVRIKAEKMIVAHRKAWKQEQEQLKHAQEKMHSQQVGSS